MRWTVHGERILYESPWITLALADVELPDGERIDYHVVRHPRPAAAVVCHDLDRGVLLIWRHRFITDTWGWEVPGGGVDEGESPEEAAVREAVEETGWRPGRLAPLGSYFPSNGRSDELFHVFVADSATYAGEPEDRHEVERVEWMPVGRVKELIAAGEVSDGFSLTALLWFLATR